MFVRALRNSLKSKSSFSNFSTTKMLSAVKLENTDESYMKDYHHVNGIPSSEEGRPVIIMHMEADKTPTQCVQLPEYAQGWFLRFSPKPGSMFTEPLMGQSSTLDVIPDCLNDFIPTFKHLEDAIKYCKMNKWNYRVEPNPPKEKIPKDYAKQYVWTAPKEEW